MSDRAYRLTFLVIEILDGIGTRSKLGAVQETKGGRSDFV